MSRKDTKQEESRPEGIVVVGLGASAGGLETFQTFFSRMPDEPGMAFVLVQHLDPNHESLMPELLSRHTAMPVDAVQDETPIEPNHVYVIPPNATLTIDGGVLRVTEPREPRGHRTPIDNFFRSLAEDQRERAVCVVLSGTGSDGTLGLKAVKECGGLAVAQAPDSAKYDSMPRSAIATSLVDLVLPVQEMPAQLLEYAEHLRTLEQEKGTDGIRAEATTQMSRIFSLLKRHTGHDFSSYKESTIVRRVQRRMQVLQSASVADYVARLGSDRNEVESLFKDLLIGVTQFFRDREAFDALAAKAVSKLFDDRGPDDAVRVWVPGCSTGEEAYSVAILLWEEAHRRSQSPELQIFATDIDERALDVARLGRYPDGIADQISSARLNRFFTHQGGGYQVNKALRETIIFSPHNVIADPPFSRLDLISCRNLLIYLEADLQRKLMPVFHYALRSDGFLFLGPSESVAATPELYRTVDKRHRIYRAKSAVRTPPLELPLVSSSMGRRSAFRAVSDEVQPTLGRTFERLLLDRYSPPAVVIDSSGHILYTSGRTGRYLELPSGEPHLDVVEMSRNGVRLVLRAAVHRAVTSHADVIQRNLKLPTSDGLQELDLVVRPITELGEEQDLYLVVFHEQGPPRPPAELEAEARVEHPVDEGVVRELERELRSTKQYLQSTVEELETSNEELKSSNEELLSMNEELQSSNEEMQTSKEELQSVNEELQTVNAELAKKVEEVDRANSDLQNLFESTRIATLFVDRELCIQRFTPAAKELFRVIDTDTGRPITDISHRFTDGDLVERIRGVLRTLQPTEEEVHRAEGDRWFVMRVLPYRTLDDVIDGAVITFNEITEQKKAQAEIRRLNDELRRRLDELETVLQAVPVGIAITSDPDAGDIRVNEAGARILGMSAAANASVAADDPPGYRVLKDGIEVPPDDLPIQRAVLTQAEVPEFLCVVERADGTRIDLRMSALPLPAGATDVRGAVGAFADVTPLLDAQRAAERRASQQARLADLGTAVLGVRSVETLLGLTVDTVMSGVDAMLCEIVLRDADGSLRLRAGEGWEDGAVGELILPDGRRSHAGLILKSDDVVRFDDLDQESRFESELLRERGVRSGMGAPLVERGEPSGVLAVFGGGPAQFSTADEMFLRTAAGILSAALVQAETVGALERSETVHRTIGEIVPFGSWTSDAQGRWTSVTRPFLDMSGMALEEVVGFGWMDRVHPDDEGPTRAAWERCVGEGGDWEWEYRIRGVDGRWHAVHTSGRPLRDDEGNVESWVGFHVDVTDRADAQEDLRRLNETLEQRVRERTAEAEEKAELLRRMAAEMSQLEQRERRRMAQLLHDHLQQLLAAAQLRVLALKVEDDENKAEVGELNELLGESLDTARGLTVQLSPPVDFDRGLRPGLEWLKRWFGREQGFTVELRMDDGDAPCSEDIGVFLFHAAKELVFNAAKHSGRDRATLAVHTDGDRLRLVVSDDGAGFGSGAEGPDVSGGFGLFNLRERVRLLGGSLDIESVPSQGSAVTISVPLDALEAPEARDDELAVPAADPVLWRPSGEDEGQIRVVIVDDHALMRDGIAALLRTQPDMVVAGQAEDGLQAVEMARQLQPDVILMDQSMPGMSGAEATSVISRELPQTAVIGLSMHQHDQMADVMLDSGAVAYFTKSGDLDALLDGIRKAAGTRPGDSG